MDENDDKNILKIVIKKQLIIINPFENVQRDQLVDALNTCFFVINLKLNLFIIILKY